MNSTRLKNRSSMLNGKLKFLFLIIWLNCAGEVFAFISTQEQTLLDQAAITEGNIALVTHKYTINLMWINRKLNETQQYIYPASNKEELSKKLLDPIFKWASANQDSTVYLWFDSALTPTAAVKNTEKLITERMRTYPEVAPIVLRDVRKLPYVVANPEVFSDKTPVFFRVDLLRVIAQVHDVSTGITPHFVYSDLDIDPLSREEIFDEETLHKLQTFGIVMAYCPIWGGFENGFSIVSNNNTYLLDAMRYVLIDLNIQRAYNALQGKFYKAEHISSIMSLVEQNMNNQPKDSIVEQKPLTPSNYSINIIWINKKLKKNQLYIHPGLDEKELHEHFFQPIFAWAAMNPGGRVNLWFDSATTSTMAVKNTTKLINDIHPEMANIVLRDVRELPYVQNHPALFSPRTPDFQDRLLQIITAMFDISTGRASYCIFGSLLALAEYKDLFDLKSLAVQDLFDEQGIKDLQKFGISITYKGGLIKGIMGGNTTRLFEILEHDWIKPNSEKAYSKLHGIECCGTCCDNSSHGLQQIIYASYPGMFKYFYHHAGFGKLTIEKFDHLSGQFIAHEYDKDTDGLTPFGLDRFAPGGNFTAYAQLPAGGIGNIWIPTKKIAAPNATLIYEDEAPIRCCFPLDDLTLLTVKREEYAGCYQSEAIRLLIKLASCMC